MFGVLGLAVQALDIYAALRYGKPTERNQKLLGIEVRPTPASRSSSGIPDYLQTADGHFQGPTVTGAAPWLAQTNIAPFPSVSYIPNTPLETQIPIANNPHNHNIFQRLANLSPYFPNPRGFGVDEYPVPPGSNVSWVNMVHRHGSRYPEFSGRAAERTLGKKIRDAKGNFTARGPIEFLNDWEFLLGAEILVPMGKQELFDSGTLHYYQYGHLYPNNGSKIIVRSTTQKRMVESAEYFLAGFFGLGWAQNATLELVIEWNGFNNTMAGYKSCNRSSWGAGEKANKEWAAIYLKKAHARITNNLSGNLDWTLDDTYNAQGLCAYDTVSLGFSPWCGLFTYEEWEGFEYSLDLGFHIGAGFGSPVGRAVGVGYVHEVLARMRHHTLSTPTAQINTTLTNNTATFPTTQTLNLDFSHDSNIISILTAFGLRQFAAPLPSTHIPQTREFILSHLEPFAGRLVIEIINAPAPVSPRRKTATKDTIYEKGDATKYVRFVLNQRTIPLGRSLPECGDRDDGWCEFETFLRVQDKEVEKADFEYACFGDWEERSIGDVWDGAPVRV
ncbi:histidine phosphatase superfamily [Dendryphion nanum]|uniref:3-phytase n=1 Tax=Dendryphion nanum TaxID=256645 RepID=A0A9P9EKD4_9PLEO|nr:histidine phosphatase superfamily [Dendryphion nanum]